MYIEIHERDTHIATMEAQNCSGTNLRVVLDLGNSMKSITFILLRVLCACKKLPFYNDRLGVITRERMSNEFITNGRLVTGYVFKSGADEDYTQCVMLA